MRMPTSSPAWCNRANRRQSQLSVLTRSLGGGDLGGRDHLTAHSHAGTGGPAHSRWGRPRSRLAAGLDLQTGLRACAPTPRHGRSARPATSRSGPGSHRDDVPVHIQTKDGCGGWGFESLPAGVTARQRPGSLCCWLPRCPERVVRSPQRHRHIPKGTADSCALKDRPPAPPGSGSRTA